MAPRGQPLGMLKELRGRGWSFSAFRPEGPGSNSWYLEKDAHPAQTPTSGTSLATPALPPPSLKGYFGPGEMVPVGLPRPEQPFSVSPDLLRGEKWAAGLQFIRAPQSSSPGEEMGLAGWVVLTTPRGRAGNSLQLSDLLPDWIDLPMNALRQGCSELFLQCVLQTEKRSPF